MRGKVMKRSLTIQLDNELFETLTELAKRNQISLAGQIRMLLAQALNNSNSDVRLCVQTTKQDKQ